MVFAAPEVIAAIREIYGDSTSANETPAERMAALRRAHTLLAPLVPPGRAENLTQFLIGRCWRVIDRELLRIAGKEQAWSFEAGGTTIADRRRITDEFMQSTACLGYAAPDDTTDPYQRATALLLRDRLGPPLMRRPT